VAAFGVEQIQNVFLAYLVPVDVDVTGNITAKLCEVCSELIKKAPWLPWQRPPF
jgi:hypothetical protein